MNLTLGELITIHENLMQLGKTNPAITYLLHGKIGEFYDKYREKIQKTQKLLDEIAKQYYVWDEKGIVVEEGKYKVSGNMTEEDFNKKCHDLLSQYVIPGLKLIRPQGIA